MYIRSWKIFKFVENNCIYKYGEQQINKFANQKFKVNRNKNLLGFLNICEVPTLCGLKKIFKNKRLLPHDTVIYTIQRSQRITKLCHKLRLQLQKTTIPTYNHDRKCISLTLTVFYNNRNETIIEAIVTVVVYRAKKKNQNCRDSFAITYNLILS